MEKNTYSDLLAVSEQNLAEKDAQSQRRKSIYLLPNAFTTAALFCGFFAVVKAMGGEFEIAAIAIFCSMVLDGMDGRVARLTNTQSAFGEQYDSLADMVSFGVAPALVMYAWQLHDLGRWGWAAAFLYCACAALRLARFNTNVGVVDKRFFQGLPSPSAAALMAGLVWLILSEKVFIANDVLPYVALGFTVFAGISMITNAPFYSGKAMDVRHTVTFPKLLMVVALMLVVAIKPSVMLFGLFVLYSLSGYVLWFLRRNKSADVK